MTELASGWRRSAAAGLLLLAVYVGLSFQNSPRGFLGTDTGGKVATLRVMSESGRFDPDLGYWAEAWDPDGRLHPLSNTSHATSGKWVNVTTLPALWVGWLLFPIGGYRAALLVPMAGSLAACFAGFALLRRLGAGERHARRGFWLLGLGSPLAVYALDFWEHSLGVALVAWSLVLLVDLVASRRAIVRRAIGAGALFGLAASLRTESLVYLAVTGLATVSLLIRQASSTDQRTSRLQAVGAGAAMLAGAAVPVVANELVERAVIGASIRSGRVTGTALSAAGEPATRAREAAITLIGLDGSSVGILLGGLFVGLLLAAALRRDPALSTAAVVGAGAVGGLRILVSGLGFVPGLGPGWVTPAFAVASSSRTGDDPERSAWLLLGAVAAAAIPIVLVTQFVGGAGPQWAGRYLLVSGFLLAVLGWHALERRPGRLQAVVAGLAVAITVAGLAWLQVRSHDVDRAFRALEARPEEVLVSDLYFFVREGGATYGDRRWLTLSPNPGGSASAAAKLLVDAEIDSFASVQVAGAQRLDFDGFRPARQPTDLRLFEGVRLTVTSWQRTG